MSNRQWRVSRSSIPPLQGAPCRLKRYEWINNGGVKGNHMMPLFSIEAQGTWTILKVAGEVNMATAPGFGKALARVCQEHRRILVDLSQVTVMDSAGVATLVEGLRWCRPPKKRFALTGVSRQVQDLLSLAKLDRAFPILSTPDKACGPAALIRRSGLKTPLGKKHLDIRVKLS